MMELEKQLKKNPRNNLERLAKENGMSVNSRQFALLMDELDPLASFRDRFAFPTLGSLSLCNNESGNASSKEKCLYFIGNSLGLKPKKTDEYILKQLNTWADLGFKMHFKGPLPAAECDQFGKESLGRLIGAKPECITLMNALTVNLHLLFMSFYQPTKERYKIVIEKQAFPSDRYAVHSQAAVRGFAEKDAIIEIGPREGEDIIRNEDIIKVLKEQGSSIAVVFLSNVQYFSGQKFDVKRITEVGQAQGCFVGWDLAHGVGNVKILLDEWNVDFACFCTYKYLNSGPGSIGGAYINSRHDERDVPHLKGWWSNKNQTRFIMKEVCDTAVGVDGFRLSNPSPFLVGCVLASLEIFDEAGMDRILEKQYLLTGYLEYLIEQNFTNGKGKPLVRIVTPRDTEQRGSHLSITFSVDVHSVNDMMYKRGVLCDIRRPDVMRVAPAPLYNTFEEAFRFTSILAEVLSEEKENEKI